MRIAANESHPDYRYDAFCFNVHLDGELLADCVHADEEAGTVTVLDFSRLQPNSPTIPTKVLRGRVLITDWRLPGFV